jgi:hypothetical protein
VIEVSVNVVPKLRWTKDLDSVELMPMFIDSGDPEIVCDDCGSSELVYEWITVDGDNVDDGPRQCACCIMKAQADDPISFKIDWTA